MTTNETRPPQARRPYTETMALPALSPIASEFATAEEAEAYDRWFHAEVEASLREADAPQAKFIPHDEVMARMEALIDGVENRKNGRLLNVS